MKRACVFYVYWNARSLALTPNESRDEWEKGEKEEENSTNSSTLCSSECIFVNVVRAKLLNECNAMHNAEQLMYKMEWMLMHFPWQARNRIRMWFQTKRNGTAWEALLWRGELMGLYFVHCIQSPMPRIFPVFFFRKLFCNQVLHIFTRSQISTIVFAIVSILLF